MSTTPTSSTALAPAGRVNSNLVADRADFSKLSPITLALAAQHGLEIVGNAAGFNAWDGNEFLSSDCTPSEIEQWFQGFDAGSDATPTDFRATALEVPAEEIAAAIATANGAVWKLDVTGEQITIIGRKFKETVIGWPAFLAFIKGYESSCYAHDLMFESIKHAEAGVPAAGADGGAS